MEMRRFLSCVLAVVTAAAAVATTTAEDGLPFDVTFTSHAPLGMRLDPTLHVVELSQGAALNSGWIQVGDELASVNGADVSSRTLDAVVAAIRKAALPKVLTFYPSKPGEDRSVTVAAKAAEQEVGSVAVRCPALLWWLTPFPTPIPTPTRPLTHAGCGKTTVELAVVGVDWDVARNPEQLPAPTRLTAYGSAAVLVYSWPAVPADFGPGSGSCAPAPVVVADPSSACMSFVNDGDVAGAVAVALRGVCAFSDKAINLQTADAAGMVVVNTQGAATSMPLADYERSRVLIPSMMVSQDHGEALLRVLEYAAGAKLVTRGRLLSAAAAAKCPPGSFFPAVDDAVLADASKGGRGADSATGDGAGAIDWSLPDDAPEATRDHPAGADVAGSLTFASAAALDPVPATSLLVDADGQLLPEADAAQAGAAAARVKVEFLAAEFGAAVRDVLQLHPAAGNGSAAPAHAPPYRVVLAEPRTACRSLTATDALRGAVLVVERGECAFVTKFTHAAAAGVALLVVINTEIGMFSMPTPVQGIADDVAAAPCAAVMVTRDAGRALVKALRAAETGAGAKALQLVAASPRPVLAVDWLRLMALLDVEQWPADARARRKLYYKLSVPAHPDRPRGHQDRFAVLSYAYRRANYMLDPEGNPDFVDDWE